MKRIARIVGIVLVLLIAVLIALPFLINANEFRPVLESKLTAALGRQVHLGDLKLALLSGGVAADDLSVADNPAFSPNPFLRAKSLKVGVELMTLIFSRKLIVTDLTIDQPEIVLLQNPSGKWNFSNLGSSSTKAAHDPGGPAAAPMDISAKLVKITDGRLSMGKSPGNAKPQTLESVNLELHDISANSAVPFSLSAKLSGGGDIQIQGKAGPIDTADATLTPLEANLTVHHVDLVASGFVEPATGISGLLSMDGTATSNGRTFAIKSKITADKWTVSKGGAPASRPLELDCAIEHNLQQRSGVLSRGEVHIGKVAASLTGTYNVHSEPAVVSLKFSASSLPLPELAADLRALDIVLPAGSSIQAGTFTANLAMQGPVDRLVTSGPIRIDNARLAGFNLAEKMAAVERLAGIQSGPNTEIQLASADVRAAPDGTTVSNIQVVSPSIGNLTGAGTISPNHALNFRMNATLKGSGGALAIVGRQSDAKIPFSIEGTSSNPTFRPDVGAIASQELQRVVGKSIGGDAGGVAGGLLKGLLGGKKP